MAIVKMKKFSLIIIKEHKEKLVRKIQKFSNIQFIDIEKSLDDNDEVKNILNKDSDKNIVSNLENEKSKVKLAMDIINKYAKDKKTFKDKLKEKEVVKYEKLREIAEDSKWKEIYKEVKLKEERIGFITNEITRIKTDIENLIPWENLDVNVEDLNSLKTCISYLGSIPKNSMEKFKEEMYESIKESYVEEISSSSEESNLFLIFHKENKKAVEEILKTYTFSKVNLNLQGMINNAIEEYKEKIEKISDEKNIIIEEMKEYQKYYEFLNKIYEYYENEITRNDVSENFMTTDKVIAMEGWTPAEKIDELKDVVNKVTKGCYFMEYEDPKEDEDVPILLKNKTMVQPFESIVEMYSLPKYEGLDPTPLMVPFYMIFFGMMLSDVGYGLIILIATVLALKFVPLEGNTKKLVRMFFYLSIPTIFWGVMYGSYFTGAIPIKEIWIKPENDPNTILIVSILFGLIHIYVGLGIKAYIYIRDKKYLDAFYDAGLWYITLTAIILYLAGSFANVESLKQNSDIIKYIMFGGMIGLVLTQGRHNKGIGAKLGGGFYGLYGITGYMGDLVSYSRLMALGLATGFIGAALNLIITFLGSGIRAWILGPIIFVIGHLFNLSINALGAYVHTSRLQYVEYFGKFYEGGGKPFTPFKYTNKFIKIKTD